MGIRFGVQKVRAKITHNGPLDFFCARFSAPNRTEFVKNSARSCATSSAQYRAYYTGMSLQSYCRRHRLERSQIFTGRLSESTKHSTKTQQRVTGINIIVARRAQPFATGHSRVFVIVVYYGERLKSEAPDRAAK